MKVDRQNTRSPKNVISTQKRTKNSQIQKQIVKEINKTIGCLYDTLG